MQPDDLSARDDDQPPPRVERPTAPADAAADASAGAGPAPAAIVLPPGTPLPPGLGSVATDPGPAPARPRRTGILVLSLLLVGVLLGAGLLLARMITVNQAWQEASADWEQLARTHGEQLATAQGQLDATSSELESVRSQLATAQQRITQLADEKAQLGDTTEAQRQLADYQERVSQAAGNVAVALASCIDGQRQLIGYMDEADRYDATQLAGFRQQVETLCGAATDANTQLQRELTR